MTAEYPWIAALHGCPQDPLYHAEGDVWIHTLMVCQELLALDAWRNLELEDRQLLFAAAVLHDVGKPACTRTEDNGRITSRGHSRRGAIMARGILWQMAVPFHIRENICNLIRYHQFPYHLIERPSPERVAIEISQTTRGDHLAILAEADVRGRITEDQERLLDNVALCAEQMRELNCLDRPYAFASDHARLCYFRDERRTLWDEAYDDTRCEVVLMSGLPGAGKDHFVRTELKDWPVVSLDALRQEFDVDPEDDQGFIVNTARDRAKEFLRSATPFVWNGTNVTRQLRQTTLNLLLSYPVRVRMVYVEAPYERLFVQNKNRTARVPEAVIHRLIDRWEVPDVLEAHRVDPVLQEGD